MGIEQRFESFNSQIVDSDEFLSKPGWYGVGELDIGRLATLPSRELLRKLPWLLNEFDDPCEVGIVRRKGIWFIFKTAEFYNRVEFTPRDSEVWIHSHPAWENAPLDGINFSLPSTSDFVYCLDDARNFVASQEGLTEYWPIMMDGERMERARLSKIITDMGIGDTHSEYLRLLNGVGARLQLYKWEELTPEKLTELLS